MGPITVQATLSQLQRLSRAEVDPMIAEVPKEWQVDETARAAWCDLIVSRARHLSASLPDAIQAAPGEAQK